MLSWIWFSTILIFLTTNLGFIVLSKAFFRSPSNIALVKYWGKHGAQLPRNTSLSFVLEKAYTETSVELVEKRSMEASVGLEFWFEGRLHPSFGQRVKAYLESLRAQFSILREFDLVIQSGNSFPHSAGIASSASAMSALALCIVWLQERYHSRDWDGGSLLLASSIARLGSGSACRSLYPLLSSWGAHEDIPDSSDQYATPLAPIMHDEYTNYRDTILIVSAEEKSVSSSVGHALMEEHPYAAARYRAAQNNAGRMYHLLQNGDLDAFVALVEHEAWSLHGLMMMSSPSYTLVVPNTLLAIERIKAFREDTGIPVCFTLDAGPNIHLLYREKDEGAVRQLIDIELKQYCQEEYVIEDNLGLGPQNLLA